MDKKKVPVILGAIAVCVFFLIYLGLTVTGGKGGSSDAIDADQAAERLDKMVNKIKPEAIEARKASVSLEEASLEDELPDISKSPLTVEGTGTAAHIEIFSSPEKAGEGSDGWLNEVARAFNQAGITVGGETASVSIRNIASGLGMDYIISGKYRPDVFAPSNEMWGDMVAAKGIPIQLEKKRLVGNVAGFLLSEEKKAAIEEKYGGVSVASITQATVDGELAMGYTNPYASSTGLNFLMSILCTYDAANPLSEQAVAGFQSFQANVPFVAYTTMQMSEAARTGALEGMILEYQTYANAPDVKSYTFTPFGARHDNPVYSLGELTEQKKATLAEFLQFCDSEENRQLAGRYGFNGMEEYAGDAPAYDGNALWNAQGLWKKEKDSGRPVTAVFVADVSGSMEGEPLSELKRSLIQGANYISPDNYVGLVSYDSDVYVNLPIAQFDLNQRSYFQGAVEDMECLGATATYDAIAVATSMLREAKEANPDTKLILFVLSDGETNEGHEFDDVDDVLKALEIPTYTIGYNANLSELEEISRINEAACINADSEDVLYKLKGLFNANM